MRKRRDDPRQYHATRKWGVGWHYPRLVRCAPFDYHRARAAEMFGVSETLVTEDMRRHAKSANYRELYSAPFAQLEARVAESLLRGNSGDMTGFPGTVTGRFPTKESPWFDMATEPDKTAVMVRGATLDNDETLEDLLIRTGLGTDSTLLDLLLALSNDTPEEPHHEH